MIAPSTVESSGTQFGRSVSVVRDAAYSAAKAAVSAKIAAKDQARKQHGALFFQRSRCILPGLHELRFGSAVREPNAIVSHGPLSPSPVLLNLPGSSRILSAKEKKKETFKRLLTPPAL